MFAPTSPKSKKLLQLHTKLSKINNHQQQQFQQPIKLSKNLHNNPNHYIAKSTHNTHNHNNHNNSHNYLAQLQQIEQQNKIIQTDISNILDQIKEYYQNQEQKIGNLWKNVIENIENLLKIYCEKLKDDKNKEIDGIKHYVQDFMKFQNKIKKIISNFHNNMKMNMEDSRIKNKQKNYKIFDQTIQKYSNIEKYNSNKIYEKVKQFSQQRKQLNQKIQQISKINQQITNLFNKQQNSQQNQTRLNLSKLQANIYTSSLFQNSENRFVYESPSQKIRQKHSHNTSTSKQQNLIQEQQQVINSQYGFGLDRKNNKQKQKFLEHLKFFRSDQDKEIEEERQIKLIRKQKYEDAKPDFDKNNIKSKGKISDIIYKNKVTQQKDGNKNKDYDEKTQKYSKTKKSNILSNLDKNQYRKNSEATVISNYQFQRNLNNFMNQLKKNNKKQQISHEVSSKQASIQLYPAKSKIIRMKSQQNISLFKNNYKSPSQNIENGLEYQKSNQVPSSKVSANQSKSKMRESLAARTGRSARFIESGTKRSGFLQSANQSNKKGNWASILKQQQARYNQMRKKIKN